MKSSHSDRLLLSPRPAWVALARVFSNLSMDRCRWRYGLRFLIEDPFLLFSPRTRRTVKIHSFITKSYLNDDLFMTRFLTLLIRQILKSFIRYHFLKVARPCQTVKANSLYLQTAVQVSRYVSSCDANVRSIYCTYRCNCAVRVHFINPLFFSVKETVT